MFSKQTTHISDIVGINRQKESFVGQTLRRLHSGNVGIHKNCLYSFFFQSFDRLHMMCENNTYHYYISERRYNNLPRATEISHLLIF